jgi:hypothetical protein
MLDAFYIYAKKIIIIIAIEPKPPILHLRISRFGSYVRTLTELSSLLVKWLGCIAGGERRTFFSP